MIVSFVRFSLTCNLSDTCFMYTIADEDEDDSDDEGRTVSLKGCSVVWEGKVLDRAFNDWKVSSVVLMSITH